MAWSPLLVWSAEYFANVLFTFDVSGVSDKANPIILSPISDAGASFFFSKA
jgi:hypothetical protein